MRKKSIAWLLLAVMALFAIGAGIVGCGGNSQTDGSSSAKNSGKRLIIYTSMKESLIGGIVTLFTNFQKLGKLGKRSSGRGASCRFSETVFEKRFLKSGDSETAERKRAFAGCPCARPQFLCSSLLPLLQIRAACGTMGRSRADADRPRNDRGTIAERPPFGRRSAAERPQTARKQRRIHHVSGQNESRDLQL